MVDNRWIFGNDVIYENGTYTLVNTQAIDLSISDERSKLNNHHYTCFSKNGSCTSVKYIYHANSSTSYYIALWDGKKVEDALNEMLYNDNVNTKNSIIKNGVDAWYKHYLLDYDAYIEDTIFCNDRSIRELGGWNPNGGNINTYLQFKEYNVTSDLSCPNDTDKFSVSNNKAKLTYKVGLMSSPEMTILNNSAIRNPGRDYWLGSPNYFGDAGKYAFGRHVYDGNLYGHYVDSSHGVRPAVSLKPGIEYLDGDGSMENPYLISMD